jgi:hypothetical protein
MDHKSQKAEGNLICLHKRELKLDEMSTTCISSPCPNSLPSQAVPGIDLFPNADGKMAKGNHHDDSSLKLHSSRLDGHTKLGEKSDGSYFDFNNTEQGKNIAQAFCNFLTNTDLLLLEDEFHDVMDAGSTDEETSDESDEFEDRDDDDSLQAELTKLAESQELLRQELNAEIDAGSMEREEAVGTRKIASSETGSYTLFDHCTFLKISEIPNLGFVCDVSEHLFQSETGLNNDVKEFCQPIPEEALSSTYFGLKGSMDETSVQAPPVRTLTIRIRPDVLCGAVMDAVFASIVACSDHNMNLLKRQGSHLRAVVVNGKIPYVLDAQLCITRSDNYQRQLVLRFYYANASELAEVEFSNTEGKEFEMPSEKEENSMNLHVRGAKMNLHLKEACSLVQLINDKQKGYGASKGSSWTDSGFPWPRKATSPSVASAYLSSSFRRSPSVRSRKRRFSTVSFVLPSLSPDDWIILQASWSLCDRICHGLADTCAYSSLTSTPIDTQSGICGLDFHFCMQLYSLSEERMMFEVQQVINKLETQVYQAETSNAIFADVTKPTFELYNVESVQESAAMDLFPLESDEDGAEVQTFDSLAKEALAASGFLTEGTFASKSQPEVADEAVRVVYSAYNTNHNFIQTGRVKRANANIMTRLFKKQLWLQETYKRLRDSFMISKDALRESKACYELAQKTENVKKRTKERLRLVPLLKFDLDSGNCYITATHIFFSLYRRFQKPAVLIFDLIELDLRQVSSCWMQIVTGEEILLKFRPSIDASRLKTFISILQSLQGEDISEEKLL